MERKADYRLNAQAVQRIVLFLGLLILIVLGSGALLLRSSFVSLSLYNLHSRGTALVQEFRGTLSPSIRHQRLSLQLIQSGVLRYDDRSVMVRYFAPFLDAENVVTSLNVAAGQYSFMILKEGNDRYTVREERSGMAAYFVCNRKAICRQKGAPFLYSHKNTAWYSISGDDETEGRWTDVYRFRTTGDPGITRVVAGPMPSKEGRKERLIIAYDLRLIELSGFFRLISADENLLPVLYFPEVRADLPEGIEIGGLKYYTGKEKRGLFVIAAADAENPAVVSLLYADAVEESKGCRWWSDSVELQWERSPKIFLCLPEGELFRKIQLRSSTVLLLAGGLLLLTIAMSFFIVRQVASPYQAELQNVDQSLHLTAQKLELRERELRQAVMKLQEELDLARKTQLSIIPVISQKYGPVHLTTRYVPASSLGGDFLDVYELSGGLGFIMADVSGHGISSALITMMIKVSSTLSRELLIQPDVYLGQLNRIIFDRTGMHFITALAGFIDYQNLKLRVANAGHCNPLRFRRDLRQFQEIEASGICLGVIEQPAYTMQEYQLQPGDSVLFFTDGITETMNESELLYGTDRLRQTILMNADRRKNELLDAILASLDRFARREIREDDIAMILLETD
jgi:sigma-B regulation protein RsbU (phosphoserine phosphatase)